MKTWQAWIILGGFTSVPAWCQLTLTQAIEATLARHPLLEVQQERVAAARGVEKEAAGPFDTSIAGFGQQALTHTPLSGLEQLEVQSLGINATDQAMNATTVTGSATRLLRSGIQWSVSTSMWRFTDNIAQTDGINLTQVRFQVNVPLLRGRGRDVVAAEESAAHIEADAALYDVNHTTAQLITDTVTRYWELIAARQRVEVWRQAEYRGQLLVQNVRTLIDAERLPRAELQQAVANQADKSAQRAAAEQQLVESSQALAVAMGSPADELARTLLPEDSLPDGEVAELPSMSENDVSTWLQRSLTRRADYLGLKRRQGAFAVRRDAVANRLKPQLDFKVATGYSGLKEGRRPDQFLASPFSNAAGVDLIGGLSYELPAGRHAALGQLEQAGSVARQNELATRELARTIVSSVLASIGAYKNSIIRVQQAKASVDASQAAVDGEREKLRLGAGSVIDLITLEDRLANARGGYVEARLNYAVLLARLRFATGAILEPGRTAQSIDRVVFYRPPWEDPKP